MLRQPLFWLMFAMMAMMSTSGLMVTSQMAVFAEDFGISKAVVFGMAALPLALTIDRFTNGLTRPELPLRCHGIRAGRGGDDPVAGLS